MSNATNPKQRKSKINKLVLASLFIALSIILKLSFEIYLTPDLRINFTTIPIILSGVALGPIWGFAVGVLSDILNFIIKPAGPGIHPGLTFVTGLTGLIPGLVVYFNRKTTKKINYSLLNIINFVILIIGGIALGVSTGALSIRNGAIYLGESIIQWYFYLILFVAFALYAFFVIKVVAKKQEINKKLQPNMVVFAVSFVEIVGHVLLSAIFLSQMFGTPAIFLLPGRFLKAIIMIPLESFIIYLLANALIKYKLVKK